MSEQKRYTAQEMRHTAMGIQSHIITKPSDIVFDSTLRDVVAMLSQAADAEEELETLKGDRNGLLKANESLAKDNDRLRGENAQLKARLEAVVKECEKQIPECRGEEGKCNPTDGGYCDENCHDEIIVYTAVTAILRAARGESETESK